MYTLRTMRTVNKQKGYIAYTLNILGIRIYAATCQMIAKQGCAWVAIGADRLLPVEIPDAADNAAGDPLIMTVCQLRAAFPDSDLIDLLTGRRQISEVLEQ
jgi:hypothetical protein